MKTFRSLKEYKDYYFPKTEEEREKEFMETATPEEIGKHWAQQSMKKYGNKLEKILKELNT